MVNQVLSQAILFQSNAFLEPDSISLGDLKTEISLILFVCNDCSLEEQPPYLVEGGDFFMTDWLSSRN